MGREIVNCTLVIGASCISQNKKKKKEDLISFKLLDLESFDLYSTFSEASQFSGIECSH